MINEVAVYVVAVKIVSVAVEAIAITVYIELVVNAELEVIQ